MSDEQISLLERYLLEQDKDKFFATLVKNSETYTNMRLIDQLNRFGLDLPKDVQTELQIFLGDSKSKKSVIQFKHRLLELQTEKDEKKRKDLIKQFADNYMSVNFSFARPANIKQSDNLKSNTEVKNPSTFDSSELGFEKAVEDFFNQSSWEKIRTFRPQFYHKFDLKRLLDKKVDCFEHVLNTVTNFSHIEDLNKLLKTYLAEKRKISKGFQLPIHFFTKMTLKQLNEYKEANPDITYDKNFISTHFQKTFEVDPTYIVRTRYYSSS